MPRPEHRDLKSNTITRPTLSQRTMSQSQRSSYHSSIRMKIKEYIEAAIAKQRFKCMSYGVVDPRKVLKDAKVTGPVDSLVSEAEIQRLAQLAYELHINYVQQTEHDQPQEGQLEIGNLERLAARVI